MKKMLIFGVLLIFFLLGFLSNMVISYVFNQEQNLQKLSSSSSIERPSPSDIVKEDQIDVQKDKITLNIKGATWSSFANTNSMDPILDEDSNAIEVQAVCDRLKVGDIVVYKSNLYGDHIVHRVYSIDSDDIGLFFRLKGDNNPALDPEKVRCDQIKYQVIGILY